MRLDQITGEEVSVSCSLWLWNAVIWPCTRNSKEYSRVEEKSMVRSEFDDDESLRRYL